MPKVKIPRKNISLDMTAMCDMAFLLLTFFMLATKFKAPETVVIDMPSSVSETKIPGKDMMIVSIANDGKVFFGIDGQHYRKELLSQMAASACTSSSDTCGTPASSELKSTGLRGLNFDRFRRSSHSRYRR